MYRRNANVKEKEHYTEVISFKASPAFKVKLDILCRRLGLKRSELIRRAIDEYIAKLERMLIR